MTPQASKPQIRSATADDAAQCRAIARAAYGKYVPRIGREPSPMRADYRQTSPQAAPWCSDRDAVEGYMVAWAETTRTSSRSRRGSGLQGEGLGGRLIDQPQPRRDVCACPR